MAGRVIVVCGGDSAEREISLQSGTNVATELRKDGFEVVLVDPLRTSLTTIPRQAGDIAFPMLHGTHGEDGVLQRQLDSLGLPFVGSTADVSELTFDKARTQVHLKALGYRVPNHQILHRDPDLITDRQRRLIDFDLPIVVKPARQGSSVGISIVHCESELASALKLAWEFDSVVIVESWIEGAEVTVPVIDGVAYPAIEIQLAAEWYDYSAKYQSNATRYRFDSSLLTEQVANLAIDVCCSLGVTGLARVDFRIDKAGQPWILEINTIPGMTDKSLVPKSIRKSGQTVARVCGDLVRKCGR